MFFWFERNPIISERSVRTTALYPMQIAVDWNSRTYLDHPTESAVVGALLALALWVPVWYLVRNYNRVVERWTGLKSPL